MTSSGLGKKEGRSSGSKKPLFMSKKVHGLADKSCIKGPGRPNRYIRSHSTNIINMRILTEVVDRLAAEKPDGLWVKAGALDNGVLSWSDITWSQLARAVDYISHWMEDRLQPPAENKTMGYILPCPENQKERPRSGWSER
ncbi:hypothetical protein N7465_002151 [Penicillium sp. CMV-2018d]|nr:hypothetical protein N7465_002151 [Penicillium sp. CMV-2018d]